MRTPRRTVGWSMVALVGILLLAAPSAAEPAAEEEPFVSGWLPHWTMASSLRAVTDRPHLFRVASPFWYVTRSAERIDSRAGDQASEVVDALRRSGVPVVPTVAAPLSPQTMSGLLTDPDARRIHVAALVDLVVTRDYDGIDLDYEHFALTDDPALIIANRDGFSALVGELCQELRSRGRLCVVTVMARTDDALQAWYRPQLGVGVYDYEALGAAVDRLRVMTYDHHYPSGPPGPVAGYGWVEDVIRYTVARVPAWKVDLGVASYGYDWGSPGTSAQARTTVGMQALAASLGVTPRWSETERERTFTYRSSGVDRTVWYQDARGLRERVHLAAKYCLAGIAMWTTGGADRSMWDTLERLAATYPAPTGVMNDDGFFDTSCSVFRDDIAWLASEGVTRSCNPPRNTMFCPEDFVTRGQMAAFLVRALGLTDDAGAGLFVDTDDSVFEGDIDRLATAGITRGCNPPTNNRFCPEDLVTRGQMAAFLVRALGLTDDGGGDLFIDDDDSVFEGDIDRLATAGITRGCNPPTNDRFCPDDLVTRGQMAAFLHRALGG